MPENTTQIIEIALDAMGGDYAPAEPVKAAVRAASELSDARIILVGPEDLLQKELSAYSYPSERIQIRNATEVITPDETPVFALRAKKDSTIVVGCKMVKNGEASVFISAGSTGALVAGGALLVGRLKGVERTPIAFELPTRGGTGLLLDCGSSVDPKPSMLVQFARMGSLYMKNMRGLENPTVGLVNIGTEDEKGNALTKATHELLKECTDLNYIGYVESRDIPLDGADVTVCDAFTGNVILKLYEGMGKLMLSALKDALMSNVRSKVGALLIKKSLKQTMTRFDYKQYGGAPLLGANGLVLKTHGNSDAGSFYNTILQGYDFSKRGVNEQIAQAFRELQSRNDTKNTAAEQDASGR